MVDTHNHKPHELERRGLLFVLSSPSGAGKSTLSRMLLAADPAIDLSVSATTRPPRPGEVEGVDYHFTDVPGFKKMVADGDLLEWAHVFGHRYGTPKAPVEAALAAGFLLGKTPSSGMVSNSSPNRVVSSIWALRVPRISSFR